MKRIILISLLNFCFAPLYMSAQNHSETDAVVGQFQQYYNNHQNDSIYNLLSDRSKGMMPADKMNAAMSQLYSQTGDLKSFEFSRMENNLAYYNVVFNNTNLTLLASLNPEKKLDAFRFAPASSVTNNKGKNEPSNLVATTPTGKLYGTLTVPETTKKVPVVLIIAGSGPTDRDCNSSAGLVTNTYKMIADSLQKAGIACARYDKRGVGESAAALQDEAKVDFNVYVSDAEAFIKLLSADPRFSEVIVAGHSEGSLVGMIAAQKGNVKKYISIAGAGERIDKTLTDQLKVQSQELADAAVKIMDSLRMGFAVKDVPESLQTLFRPSIQPFMRAWLKYDPQLEIKKLKIPTLLVQGKNDLQVSMKNVENLEKAAPKAKVALFDNMNHILKDAPADRQQNFATYNSPDLGLTPGFMMAMVKFVKG